MASSNSNKNIPRVLDFEDDESGVGGTSGGDTSNENGGSNGSSSTKGVVDDSSFYGVLNVPVNASDDDLKRSFRLLAAACHPDKVRDPELRPAAAEAFAKVQAAYEILSDPEKRSIYDIYGKQGLEAGLQLGDKLKSTEELRKEWAAFQARRAAATLEARVAHRGAYVVKVDASGALLQGGGNSSDSIALPDLAGMAMSTQVQVPLGEKAGATLGGQVATRRGGVGVGAFLAGVRRVVGSATTVDVHAQLGLKQVLTLSSERQLDDRTSSGFALSWQPPRAFFGAAAAQGISGMIQRRRAAAAAAALGGAASGGVLPPILRRSSSSSSNDDGDDEASRHGFGLTLTSGRRFSEKTDGDVSWTVGPEDAAGCSLGFTRRGESVVSSARVEVGAVTGLSARFVWRPARTPRLLSFLFFSSTRGGASAASSSSAADNEEEPTELAEDIEEEEETGFASNPSAPSLALRASVRLNTQQGLELEIGFSKRLSEFAVAGVALAAGTSSGVTLRPRFSRGGHAFDFPILLARSVAPLSASRMLQRLPAEVREGLMIGGGGGEDDEPAPSFLYSSPFSPPPPSPLSYEDSADPVALAILLLGPPACSAALQLLVLRPLRRRAAAKRAALRRAATAAQADASTKAAEDAAKLLGPVARRRAAKEVAGALGGGGERAAAASANGGFVVVRARYGPVAALDAAARRDRREEGEEKVDDESAPATIEEGEEKHATTTTTKKKKELGSHLIPDFEAAAAEGGGAASTAAATGEVTKAVEEEEEGGGESSEGGGGDETKRSPSSAPLLLTPRFVDVTAATRLLVDASSSTITLQKGATRHALLGFADPAPGERKALEVLFVSSGGLVLRARVPDGAGAVLPPPTEVAAASSKCSSSLIVVHPVPSTHRDALAAVAEVESLVPGAGEKLAAALARRRESTEGGGGSGGSGDGAGGQAKPRRRRFGIV